MVDADTFPTILYVVVDEFGKAHLPPKPRPGPAAALTRSELLTLALFGRWSSFGSERAFYRYARRHLCGAFPTLPPREQFKTTGAGRWEWRTGAATPATCPPRATGGHW